MASLDAARARRQKNLRTSGIVAAALALAASVFVMMRHKEERPMALAPAVQPSSPPNAEPGGAKRPPPSEATGAAEPEARSAPGVDVDVDGTEGESVRVFYLSNESSPTTSVVVWVDESGGK